MQSCKALRYALCPMPISLTNEGAPMSQEEKVKYTIDIVKFFIYLITLIIGIVVAYNSLDKRLSVIETQMQYKVDVSILLEKLDIVKVEINNKIETEIRKITPQDR